MHILHTVPKNLKSLQKTQSISRMKRMQRYLSGFWAHLSGTKTAHMYVYHALHPCHPVDRLGFCAEIGVIFGTVYTLMLVLLDDSLWGAQAVCEGGFGNNMKRFICFRCLASCRHRFEECRLYYHGLLTKVNTRSFLFKKISPGHVLNEKFQSGLNKNVILCKEYKSQLHGW